MGESERLYESIGVGYADARRPDPRVAEQILDAIGPLGPVLNVGAGTGNYEPEYCPVVAVEPAVSMVNQRRDRFRVVRAVAEQLPFVEGSFEAAMAIFTIHHWSDARAGLCELGRVSRRQVSLVYDTSVSSRMWLIDYFPQLATAPWEVNAPGVDTIGECLIVDDVRVLWVPPDCTDGFTGCYWNRPERYLEPAVQAGMSTLARLTSQDRQTGTERLRAAIESGGWDQLHGTLRRQARFDMGYRLVVSHSQQRPDVNDRP